MTNENGVETRPFASRRWRRYQDLPRHRSTRRREGSRLYIRLPLLGDDYRCSWLASVINRGLNEQEPGIGGGFDFHGAGFPQADAVAGA